MYFVFHLFHFSFTPETYLYYIGLRDGDNGDKKAAFEELVCLLAMLEKADDRIEFERKGRGADAGVECYWKTNDGSEICWQAKYFTDNIRDVELSEIDKSIKTAINKHPKMKEY